MRFKKILVPFGGSEYAQCALQYAIMLARSCRAELTGLFVEDIRFFDGPWFHAMVGHVIPQPYFDGSQGIEDRLNKRARAVREHFHSACRKSQVSHSFKVAKGMPSDVILKKADAYDCVVMGKRGENATWLQKHLGSVASRVMQHIDRPLILVDRSDHFAIRKIMLCYAGGPFAKRALGAAAYLAHVLHAELCVVTVATGKTKAFQVQRDARAYLDDRKIFARYLVTVGSVEKEILKLQRVEKAELIITGASKQAAYEDFISLCLTSKLVHETNVPLLITR